MNFSPRQMRQCSRFTGTPCSAEKDARDPTQQDYIKVKYCANPTYECNLLRIDGYDYCIRHILRDPQANYRQCTFVYANGKKCPNAVPKSDSKKEPIMTTLCFEHNRQTQLQKTRVALGRLHRIETNESMLNSLAHHLNADLIKEEPIKTELDDDEIDVVSPHVEPFENHEVSNISTVVSNVRTRRRVVDYASDTSSNDEDLPSLKNTTRDYDTIDYESADSEEDDQLKHASIYTRTEAVGMAETKLTKLQGLYLDQIKHLHLVLKEKRRQYLVDIRKERETYCSIHDQLKDSPHERKLYEQLKALNSYHRRQGVEAVLYKKYKDKRARCMESLGYKVSSFTKCVFAEGGVKCGDRALPCSKYCRKHILEDKKQVLFRACNVEKSGVVCQEPVPYISDDATCVLHLTVPAKRQYIQKKNDSETEEDDALPSVKGEQRVKVEKLLDERVFQTSTNSESKKSNRIL